MLKLFIYIIGGIIGLFLYVKFMEAKGIYFPTAEIEVTPKSLGFVYQDLYIKTEDNLVLHGWFIPDKNAQYILIFSHGNAGNISHRLEKVSFLYNLGLSILIFDYRGYGKSQGK
ncbi:MAG: alpha/beta hydrolase, partial [Candidatus Omnitrophica bacterium]|nr:alpha/beta hydrolase [Candidatus Omnitrophota bacterium]